MAKTTVLQADPHRLKALKGPEQKLEAHPEACGLEDLPDHVRKLEGNRPLAVDLFCGAGGLSLGLHRAGFEVILGADIRPDSIATHRHHFGGCSHKGDLSNPEELQKIILQLNRCGDIALVAGGPPCQPFSRNIRWRKHDEDVAGQHWELNSSRRELWESFMTVVEDVRPRAFLMENVPDIALTGDQEIFRNVVSRGEAADYRVHARIVYAWQYGVPQLRPRLFIAGTRIGYTSPLQWPDPECTEQTAPSLLDAIGDLPSLDGDWWEDWQANNSYVGPSSTYQRLMRDWLPVGHRDLHDHITRKVREDDKITFELMRSTGKKYHELDDEQRRYQVTSRAQREGRMQKESGKEHSFGNKYNVLEPDQPCITITAHMSKDGYWYIHPSQNRTLSIREAARVQSFPDGFRFHGTPSNRFHQVGEAVAPLVGFALGKALLSAVQKKEISNCWLQPEEIRSALVSWYGTEGGGSQLPWARQRENGEEIPEALRAWRVFLGELSVATMKIEHQALYWKRLLSRWPDHDVFLKDPEPSRRRTFRSLQLERAESLLHQVAIELREDLPWSEWVRRDLDGLGRDRIRQCLAMVGITADRSCNVGLGRMVGRVMGIEKIVGSGSRQLRELHLGLMLGGDSDGRVYRAAVAVADRWCTPEPLCNGARGGNDQPCPMCLSGKCSYITIAS
ncbi:DNA cytosine methyltransferase [Synechococcus sp. CS-1326]|uniref:DNA cytosine methyltransferase n=1 Tax=Synechococcus sp. CS-1326 TaxID=2847978 RepID=UPI00223BB425|nr:DNA cytosine methyltransferase [Synechococcus sp. CS-1326]MCT0213277.1 DNA cytosine methyltransferase [Synechococcus sp. CS-1326]